MPTSLFKDYQKPVTVFQLPWHLQSILQSVDDKFLQKFEVLDSFYGLIEMREALKEVYEEHINQMLSRKSPT